MSHSQTISKCERCGAILDKTHIFGSEKDGAFSHHFCCYCLKDGIYTSDSEVDSELRNNIYNYVISRKNPKETVSREELLGQISNLINGFRRWSIYSLTEHNHSHVFNRCLLYINENLSKELTLKEIANVAGISGYYFHRLFVSVTQEPPAQYIRRLRLERAMFDLLMTTKSLNEVAESVGYGNRSALTKSFKKHYNKSPLAIREHAIEAKSGLDPSEYIIVEPEIRKVESFTLLYTRIKNGCCEDSTFLETWKSILAFAELDGNPHKDISYFGIGKDCPIITPRNKMRVFTGISGLENIIPFSVFRLIKIIGGTFAVFRFRGDYANIKQLYTYIYHKWIYEVDYEISDITFYEKYLYAPTAENLNNIDMEVYIPIKKKASQTNFIPPGKSP